MKILVIGNGGREHAIVWKVRKDDPAVELYCAPGNAGTASIATNLSIKADDIEGIVAWAVENNPDLVIVGPEVPLCLGLVDALTKKGIRAFGPCQAAAQMEGSKKFAKDIMLSAGVPTARCAVVHTPEEARAKIKEFGIPVVLKADGLAAGKGVSVCMNQAEVEEAIDTMLITKSFGESASEVLIEEFMTGEEASILAFVDGEHIVPLASAQDHKRLLNNDKGPNTGGMGSYSPAPCVTEDMLAVVQNRILEPVVAELRNRGIVYKGILYAGIMLTPTGPRVVEFNCRFGDPETQSILPRMDFNMVEAMNACIDGTLSKEMIKWKPGNCVCVVMVAGGYPGKYDKDNPIEGIAAAEQDEDVDVFHAGTALKNGTVVTAGGRVLGVTAHGPDLRETVAKAYRAILKIKYDGAEYRTDIAHRALKLEKE